VAPVSFDARPARLSRGLALLAAALAAFVALADALGAVLGAAGLVCVAAGVLLPARSLVDAGAAGLAAGVAFAAGAYPVAFPLTGTVAAVVAWDLGEQAVGVGEQLGREADTRRLELVHAGTTLALGSVTAAVGFALYRVAFRGVSFATLLLLLAAAMFLMLSLRE
jgi:hypothetical protein